MAEVTAAPKHLTYVVKSVFRDKDWMVKTGAGGILSAVTVISLLYSFMCLPIAVASWSVIVGYTLRVIRRRVEDSEAPLPEWNEWTDLFMSGITWIAFQFSIWLFVGGIAAGLMMLASFQAWQGTSHLQMYIWLAAGVLLGVLLSTFTSLLSAYVMVNFACQENARAALAFPSIVARIKDHPLWYAAGFLIAVGLQWAWVVIPIITVIGSVVIPTTYFIGQLMSAYVLAYFWSATENLPVSEK